RRLPVGSAGAVSAPGVLAGVAGAALMGVVGVLAGILPAPAVAVVAAAGIAGSLAESLALDLGRVRGLRLDHEFANAFNTLVGALVAVQILLSMELHALFLPVAGA
ncbi:MAG TPA: DUF92 domain-containing protein, partial [Thermoanaerobaculia bacterium]|nr:DUF92 domain-containing protein [Thermoanaerobaculia bacterium]